MEIQRLKVEELVKKLVSVKINESDFSNYTESLKRIMIEFPVLRRFTMELLVQHQKNKNFESWKMKGIIEALSVNQTPFQVEKNLNFLSKHFNIEKILKDEFKISFKKTLSLEQKNLFHESSKFISKHHPFTFKTFQNSFHINYNLNPDQVLEDLKKKYNQKTYHIDFEELMLHHKERKIEFSFPPSLGDVLSEIIIYFEHRIEKKDELKNLSFYFIEFLDFIYQISPESIQKLIQNCDYNLLNGLTFYFHDIIIKKEYITVIFVY